LLEAEAKRPELKKHAQQRARDETRLVRLERIAEELNAWLFAIASRLALLYVTVLVAKYLPALPVPPAATAADIPSPPVCLTFQRSNQGYLRVRRWEPVILIWVNTCTGSARDECHNGLA
jgi:hypothetical protein